MPRARHGSILTLESNDIASANFNVVGLAVQEALKRRHDAPDLVLVVETDGGPFHGWVVHNRTGIPLKSDAQRVTSDRSTATSPASTDSRDIRAVEYLVPPVAIGIET